MALAGTALKAGGLGLAAALMTSAFGQATGADSGLLSTLSEYISADSLLDMTSSILSWLDLDTSLLGDGSSIRSILESGLGGPATALLGSIFMFSTSSTLGKLGLMGSIGWLAIKAFQMYHKGEFNLKSNPEPAPAPAPGPAPKTLDADFTRRATDAFTKLGAIAADPQAAQISHDARTRAMRAAALLTTDQNALKDVVAVDARGGFDPSTGEAIERDPALTGPDLDNE